MPAAPEQQSRDITNVGLGRFLSVEILASMLTTAVAMGVLYATITANVEANQDDVADLRIQQAALADNVVTIEKEVVKISSKQEHFAEDIDEIKGDIKDVKQLLLDISRERPVDYRTTNP